MNILLHICCAPCAIYAVEGLREEGHTVAGFFYNPNIHPYAEYELRMGALKDYAKAENLAVLYGDYEIEKYFQNVVYDEGIRERCPVCWWMRLEKTVERAREFGFDAFTTTLLGSPYQEHAVIKSLGEDIAGRTGIKFYYKDFRTGFKAAHAKARGQGLYCQKYCGCLFSEKERAEKIQSPGPKDQKKKGSKPTA